MSFPLASTHPDGCAAHEARTSGRALLAQALTDSRERTLALFAAYEAALQAVDMAVPYEVALNPPLWELGHIGWFQEWWLARYPERTAGVLADPLCPRLPSRLAGADGLYNSSEVPHPARWRLPLPDAHATKVYLAATLDDSLRLLARSDETDAALYFHRLALFHEDMHAEAAVYMAQALGIALPGDTAWPLPRGAKAPSTDTSAPRPATGEGAPVCPIPACEWTLGSGGSGGSGFAFDNELGAHAVALAAFEIDAEPVNWARYLPFVEAGGYRDPRWWSPQGWLWLQRAGEPLRVPRYLHEAAGIWSCQRFGDWQPLDPQAPAVHLSAFEADAWCRWAGRRLPTEAEWECAALSESSSMRQPFRWGRVWDWTSSVFEPWPGFVAHPYRDYSAPWFGTRRVLRGACVATSPRIAHPNYRNFFPPERNDIFAGFRSCATVPGMP